MKITSKGQVTVPLPIRDEFDFKPGTEVELVVEAGKIIFRRKRRSQSAVRTACRRNCVINEYIPSLGIGPHKDYAAFGLDAWNRVAFHGRYRRRRAHGRRVSIALRTAKD